MMKCGYGEMWIWCNVDMMKCGYVNVDMVKCGYGEMWV
jgi:hypothetical protein